LPFSAPGFDYGAQQPGHHETANPDHPPPTYTELPGNLHNNDNRLGTNAIVAEDGRVNIRIDQKSRVPSQLILPRSSASSPRSNKTLARRLLTS
jgi:hypothetical protein